MNATSDCVIDVGLLFVSSLSAKQQKTTEIKSVSVENRKFRRMRGDRRVRNFEIQF